MTEQSSTTGPQHASAEPTSPKPRTGAPATPAWSEVDEARRHSLGRMKLLALSLLLIAAVIYVATLQLDHGVLWGYVNTGAEAAMVGAMADWFAVTALFRHPMGIKIPHTAIVPTKKDEIAVNLQDFFTENFLTEAIARDRLSNARIGMRIGRWLQNSTNSRRAITEILRIGRAAVARVSDDEVRTLADDVLLPRLVREPVASVAGDLLDGVVRDGSHHALVDLLAGEIHTWLKANPKSFQAMVENRAPWWAPDAINTRVVNYAYDQAVAWAADVQHDPAHPTRQSLDDLLLRVAQDLQNDPGVQQRAESLKTRLLSHPQTSETAVSLWRSIRNSLLTAIDDDTSALWKRGQRALLELGDNLVADDELRDSLDGRLEDMSAFMVNTYGKELSSVISHTIQRWDGEEAAQRIELHVGRDLQFIRINGTVVGALVGLLIHAFSQLVG